MLKVPDVASGTREEQKKLEVPAPCFRCLFEKEIPDSWCDPQTCEMIEFWLRDENFAWEKYFAGWSVRLEQKAVNKYALPQTV